MRYAFAYGADAVYAGQPRYSLRTRNNDFTSAERIAAAIDYAHARGRQFFLASNVLPHDNKVRTYLRDIEPVVEAGPDALIMADPGLIMLVRERWPELPVHLSVQANTTNSAAVKFWHSAGVARVILSRELGLEEIESIRQQCPDMELEVFVHGALCIAYSGRCLLSGYFNHRDPNQGACTNACRWDYKVHAAQVDDSGDLQRLPKVAELPDGGPPREAPVAHWAPPAQITAAPVLIEEASRPGDYMEADEDEHGSYIMNSRDLRAVQHVARLAQIGIDSLKIEGRTKSYFYAARTAQVYRRAIDDAVAGRPFDMAMMEELEGLANRGYTEGFYRRHVPEEYQNYAVGASRAQSQRFVGEVLGGSGGWLDIEVKNKIRVGDRLELLTPSGNHSFDLQAMRTDGGKPLAEAPGGGYRVSIPTPDALDGGFDTEFALLVGEL